MTRSWGRGGGRVLRCGNYVRWENGYTYYFSRQLLAGEFSKIAKRATLGRAFVAPKGVFTHTLLNCLNRQMASLTVYVGIPIVPHVAFSSGIVYLTLHMLPRGAFSIKFQ